MVGTPGRVMDHLARESLKLDALNTLVLDEADRMLDMGFFEDIVTVARQCPKARQTLLFSATYPEGIAKLAAQFKSRNANAGKERGDERRTAGCEQGGGIGPGPIEGGMAQAELPAKPADHIETHGQHDVMPTIARTL